MIKGGKKMNNYQWIWQYSKDRKKTIFLGIILLVTSSLLMIANPLIIGQLIDRVIGAGETEKLIPLLMWMIGLTVLRTVFRYAYQITFETIGQHTVFGVRQHLFQKLQLLDFDFFNRTRVGDIMARMTGDIEAIRHFVCWVTYNIVESVFWFVMAIVVMAWINPVLMLSLVAVTPVIYYLTRQMSAEAHPVFLEIRQSFSKLNSLVEENISGNRVVKAFSREDFEIEKFNEANEAFKQKNLASARVSMKYLPWLDGLAGSLTLITLLVGGFLVIRGQMTVGDLVAFNGYLWMLNMPMRMSGWLINDTQRFNASCVKIREMLEVKPLITAEKHIEKHPLQGHIVFEDVTFHFSDDPDTPILSNVSFEALPGQTIGILGETGSGKTTLVNLIARFYDPSHGRVLIDGKDAREWPVRQLRENIAMVMQDVFLFSSTIEENITYGAPELSDERIRHVAEIADANHFIEQMPEGYRTIVGERGVGLSGGQKQRLSLARALAKDPAVLILDDTTSAVDMQTESKIQAELTKLTKRTTTFVIAHRISSVREADTILVLEKGRVVEQGTHQALVERGGRYFDIYQTQLGQSSQEGGQL